MSEFYLSHVALVGARMSAFENYGFFTRNDLSMCRVSPDMKGHSLESLSITVAEKALSADFPLWIHNIIADPDFPLRHELVMPLRRFEGELKDSKDNGVISAVLSAGFKNRTLDPLNLPDSMPLRQRCSMVINNDSWQEAYMRLERDIIKILTSQLPALTQWMTFAEQAGNELIEYSESA